MIRETRSVPAAGLLLRSLVVQGVWNYRTMLGHGFAFALLPTLRRVYRDDPDGLARAIERHSEHFNAHPYLVPIALGAVARLETDGEDDEIIRRFRTAVRGPLGGLGDTLIWATWLPLVAVCSLLLYWSGVPAWGVVLAFTLTYNAGHLGLRLWGLRLGLDAGRAVGTRLNDVDLASWVHRLQTLLTGGLGLLCGVLLATPGGLSFTGAGSAWSLLAATAFVAGLVGGHRMWRPAAVLTVCVTGFIGLWGMLS